MNEEEIPKKKGGRPRTLEGVTYFNFGMGLDVADAVAAHIQRTQTTNKPVSRAQAVRELVLLGAGAQKETIEP